MWRNPEQPRVEASPGFLLLLGALFWLDEGVGLLPWGLLACIVHELGHIAAALACGGRVERLSLTMVGAELSFSYRTPLSYGRDSLVALAGPGANLLLGAFNLLPIPSLDGGRALYLLTSWWADPGTADQLCRRVGLGCALGLTAPALAISLWHGAGLFLMLGALGTLLPQLPRGRGERRRQGLHKLS